jgi:hypothetical protein
MGVAEFTRISEIVINLMCDVRLPVSPNELVALVGDVDSPYALAQRLIFLVVQ